MTFECLMKNDLDFNVFLRQFLLLLRLLSLASLFLSSLPLFLLPLSFLFKLPSSSLFSLLFPQSLEIRMCCLSSGLPISYIFAHIFCFILLVSQSSYF